MIRERLARAALLAYPRDARERLGAEMLGTVLDAAPTSRPRFAGELADLVRLGLRARAAQTAAAGARRVVLDGLCLAAVWVMTLDLSTLLSQRARGMHDPLLAPASLALLGIALALALVGFERVAGTAALAWTAARFPALLDDLSPVAAIAATLPAVIAFTTLVAAPRKRPRDARRLAWLLVPGFLVVALSPPPWEQSPILIALVAVAAFLVALYTLITLPTDPRTAIAAAVTLSTLGSGPALVFPLLAIAVTMLRVRQLRRTALI